MTSSSVPRFSNRRELFLVLSVHDGKYKIKGSEARVLGRTSNAEIARRSAIEIQNRSPHTDVFAMEAGEACRFYKLVI